MATTFVDTTSVTDLAAAKYAFDQQQLALGTNAQFTWFGAPWPPTAADANKELSVSYQDDPTPTVSYVAPTNIPGSPTPVQHSNQASYTPTPFKTNTGTVATPGTPVISRGVLLGGLALLLLYFWR